MTIYHRLLEQVSLRETAVDCRRCSSQWKCCTYRPFIANFLVGLAQESAQITEATFDDWDFLIVGLAPGTKYRHYFAKKGRWGFGTDENLLCSFYEKSSGGCRIWQARPAVCRTFFCKSSGFEAGLAHWGKAEEFSWHLEWVLLEDFLFTEGWTIEEIAVIKRYLDEKSLGEGLRLGEEFRFEQKDAALGFYRRAWEHVSSRTEKQIQEILGDHGRRLYADLLAGRADLGY